MLRLANWCFFSVFFIKVLEVLRAAFHMDLSAIKILRLIFFILLRVAFLHLSNFQLNFLSKPWGGFLFPKPFELLLAFKYVHDFGLLCADGAETGGEVGAFLGRGELKRFGLWIMIRHFYFIALCFIGLLSQCFIELLSVLLVDFSEWMEINKKQNIRQGTNVVKTNHCWR